MCHTGFLKMPRQSQRQSHLSVSMRFRSLVAACALLIGAAGAAAPLPTAPDWVLQTAEGEQLRLSERAQGQVTVLFFWATWCPYCKALMPHLQSIRLEYGGDVEILAINFREDGDPVAFLRDAGYDFVLLPGAEEVADTYGVQGTPGVYVIDGARRVHFDLRKLPPAQPPRGVDLSSNTAKAAYITPWWAAEIRKGIDDAIAGASPGTEGSRPRD